MTSLTTLNRLLSRLDHTLLDANAKQLKSSQYERNRVGANLEHARNILLTLERQSATVRVQSQRQQQQAELQQKRDFIKKLSSRLRTFNDLGDVDDDEEEEDEDEVKDTIDAYAPARKDADAGLETGGTQAPRIDKTQQQELRSRRPLQDGRDHDIATSSAREQLLSGASRRADAAKDPSLSATQRTETMMTHNRAEQENLTDGLLSLARALKESSIAFGSSLETEKEVMKRAESGLDKNATGMEAAERRMSTLRKMSEGQGWWGRLKLYGFIFGLWLACFLLVFVGPKLRF